MWSVHQAIAHAASRIIASAYDQPEEIQGNLISEGRERRLECTQVLGLGVDGADRETATQAIKENKMEVAAFLGDLP
jgi:hypothetical protein